MKSSICSVILLSISSSALAASNGSTLLRGAPAIEGSNKDEVERGSKKEQHLLLPVVDAFHDWEDWEDDEKGPSSLVVVDFKDYAEMKSQSLSLIGTKANEELAAHFDFEEEAFDNFVDEGESCRGNGMQCLINDNCCSGKCEEPATAPRVYICVSAEDDFNARILFGGDNGSFLEEGSTCRGNGSRCFGGFNCCSGRCEAHVSRRVCTL